MRTAVYIRVSTDDQAREGFSIAAQREKLLAYVCSQDWEVAEIYADEGVSAKDTNRPALNRLLADLSLGKIDVVLVYRLDRLTRSVLDLYQLLQEFERHGVHFKSCTEVYDTTTAMGRLFITLVAALAQWERENLAERVKLGMGQMARERKRPGGPPPFGYVLVNGQLHPHPEEAKLVRAMYTQYALGSSPRDIADEANRQGFRGKNGARWSASAVLRLLKNPVYCGSLRWNHIPSGQRQKLPGETILEVDAHSAIVEEETFSRVQKRISERTTRHPRTLSSSFLFSGLLFCSRCHSMLRGKTARVQGRSGARCTHIYYLCSGRQKGICQAPALREDRLEQALIQQLQDYAREAHAAVRTVLSRKRQTGSPPPDRQAEQLLLNWELIWASATREERKMLVSSLVERIEAEAVRPAASSTSKAAVALRQLTFR